MTASDAAAGRALILALAAAGFASTFAGRTLEPLVGVVARDMATEVQTIALLSAAFSLPYAFIQPILGPLGDSIGKARVMQGAMAVLAVSLLASALAWSVPALFGLRVIAGAAAGGVIPLALAMIGDRFDMAHRQVAISRFLTATIAGNLVGSSAAGVLEASIGWRGVFALASALAALGCLAVLLRLRPRTVQREPFSFGASLARYRELLAIPRARRLFALVFAEGFTIFGVFPYLAPHLEAGGGGGAMEAGFAFAAFALGGIAYTLLVSVMLRLMPVRVMVISGGVLSAVALASLGIAPDWRLYAAALGVLGLGFFMMHNSFQTQVTEVAPQSRGSATALHAFSFFVGQAIAVALAGWSFAWLGDVPTFLLCGSGALGVGLAAAALVFRQPRAQ